MGACRSPHGCNRIVQPLPRPTTTGPKTVLRASAPKGLTGMQHQKAARRSGAQGRHPVHNSLGYGRECGICSAFGKFLDEVTPFLQAPGKLGIQGDRACNDKGQEKADKMAHWVRNLLYEHGDPQHLHNRWMLPELYSKTQLMRASHTLDTGTQNMEKASRN